MSDLEARVRRLEDIEEIRKLKHYYYAACIDRMVCLHDERAIAELIGRFTDDIEIDFTTFPIIRGKQAVGDFFAKGVPSWLSWCQHRVMNEVIEVDGDSARGQWYFDCPAFYRGETGGPLAFFRRWRGSVISGSGLVAGRYIEDYVREGGIWKWKRIEAQLDVNHGLKNAFDGARYVEKNR